MFIIMPNRFRAAALSVVLLLLGLFLSPQVAAEEDPTWPGLPKLREPTDGGALWLGLSVSGAQEIAMAKQWFQIPKTIIAAQSRSEEHTSELQSLMRTSYAVFCLKKKKTHQQL